FREGQCPVVLHPVLLLAPGGVVEVLAPTRGIHPGGLDVAIGIGADPDIRPGRRDGQLGDALLELGVGNGAAVLVAVAEPASGPHPTHTRCGEVGAAQPGHVVQIRRGAAQMCRNDEGAEPFGSTPSRCSFAPSTSSGSGCEQYWCYLSTLTTLPAPTVRPPSRMAKPRPSSIAIGWIRVTVISVVSPGMTISVPSGSVMTPVTSVVRK